MCTEYLYIFEKLRVSGIHICELYSKHHGQLAANGHQVHYTVEKNLLFESWANKKAYTHPISKTFVFSCCTLVTYSKSV